MQAHHSDVVTMVDVADACGTGLRTLEIAFREVRGQTPQQALAEIRLWAARRALAAGGGGSVTDVALRCGFTHLGRFSVAYGQRFDEPPSATLRRGRQ
jgi:transcriptional regulator GlxA family with amidase domain